jgi:hypothetical protein
VYASQFVNSLPLSIRSAMEARQPKAIYSTIVKILLATTKKVPSGANLKCMLYLCCILLNFKIMASIKYSGFISDVRGSVNGSTFSKNHYGSYMKNKVSPIIPITPFVSKARANLSFFASSWRTLTQSQRDSWKAFASNMTFFNKFGDSYTPSSFNVFCMINMNSFNIDGSFLAESPLYVNPSISELISVTFEDTDVYHMFVNSRSQYTPNNSYLLVYCSNPLSIGTNYIQNRLYFVGYLQPLSSFPLDIYPMFAARFNLSFTPCSINFKFIFMHETSCIASSPQYLQLKLL